MIPVIPFNSSSCSTLLLELDMAILLLLLLSLLFMISIASSTILLRPFVNVGTVDVAIIPFILLPLPLLTPNVFVGIAGTAAVGVTSSHIDVVSKFVAAVSIDDVVVLLILVDDDDDVIE